METVSVSFEANSSIYTISSFTVNTGHFTPPDTTPPAAPTLDLEAASDTGARDDDNITNDTTPTLTGTAEAGALVVIQNQDGILGSTTANGSGAWGFTPTLGANITHEITATARDSAGNNSSASAPLILVIDTIAPSAPGAPDLETASDTGSNDSDNITNDTTPTFTGTAEANAFITIISDEDGQLGTTTAIGTGAWSFTASNPLTDKTDAITVTARDAAGNTSSASAPLSFVIDSTAPPAPSTPDLLASSDTGSSDTDNITNDNTPTFETTVSADTAEVRFFRDGSTQIGTATPTSTSVEYTSYMTLPDGAHTITAVAVDAAGNESAPSTGLSITIDTVAPTANTPDLLASSDLGPFDDDDVTNIYDLSQFDFAVAGEDGATVRITNSVNSNEGSGVISGGSVVVRTGNWFGVADVIAEVTDLAGNSAQSSPLQVTAEASGPRVNNVTYVGVVNGRTNQTSLQAIVDFDQAVFDVDTADFSFSGMGGAGSISGVTGSGTTYTLSITGLVAGDSYSLDCVDDDPAVLGLASITSLGGSPLLSCATFTSVTVDADAPSLVSIARDDPTDEVTTSDTLRWRVEFSENVTLSLSDFSLEGTTATISTESCDGGAVKPGLGGPRSYGGAKQGGPMGGPIGVDGSGAICVRASGGDLADLNGTVRLRVASTVTDSAGNPLSNTTPSGAWEDYQVSNLGFEFTDLTLQTPAATPTNADSVTWRIDLSNSPGASVDASDFTVSGTTADLSLVQQSFHLEVTASGGDLAGLNGPIELGVGPGQDMASITDVPLSNPDFISTQAARQVVLDNTPPTLTSIAYDSGLESPTDADTLAFLFTYSEALDPAANAVSNLLISGTTATASITPISPSVARVVLSGGDLAELNGPVSVSLSSSANIPDAAGNLLVATEPTGTNENTVQVQNDATPPSVTITTASADPVSGAFPITVTFSEPVTGFELSDLTVGNGAASNFAGSDAVYTADITPAADGTVTVDIAAGVAADAAGNDNTAATQLSLESDATPPSVTITTASSDPVSGPFAITVTFSEPVTGFALGDLTVGNGAASNFAGSGAVYTADITPASDGTVTVDIAAGVAADSAGNANTPATQLSLENDATPPSVTITTASSDPVSGAFAITVTFNEPVTGFALEDLVVVGATASDLTGDGPAYSVTLTPNAEATEITVDIAPAVAVDLAGNESLVAETFSIGVDQTPPAPTLGVPGDTVEGPFLLTVDFGEPVTGFELSDLTATNADLSDLVDVGEGVFTLTVTPQTLGVIELTLAQGAAQDAAGNASLAASLSVEAITRPIEVAVTVDSATADPTDIKGTATITNPGSAEIPFRAFANVPWLRVTPTSGTIPALGDIELTVEVTDAVNDLAPGDYTGTVTVVRDIPAGSASAGSGTANATETIIVEIPVAVTLQQRFGTVELVATTPSGVSGDASFAYASDLEAFNGLTLTTRNGRASASAGQTLFGTYALTQSSPPGWRVESIACAGDLDGGSTYDVDSGTASIDLDPGESLICTVENVRDEDAVRLATQRAIRNFMARRADRIIEAAPDLSRRFEDRNTTQRGSLGADVDGSGRYQMAFSASLSGMRNAAAASDGAAQFANPERAFMDGWDVWLSAEVSGVSDNRAGERAESDFGVAQLGVDYQLGPDLILGALAQYDWMDEQSGEIFESAGAIRGARVEGEGWMAGPYAVWRIQDRLTFDGLAMYGRSDNTVDPLGLYEDAFTTDRFMIRANLTGEFVSGAWRLRPQAGITHFEETQDAYVDSLGFAIPEQSLSLGRLRAGPEVAWRSAGERGGWFEITTALNAVWDYEAAELLSETGQLTGGAEDLRADARLGLAARTPWGAVIRLETGYAGLGAGAFEARSARFEIRLPFGAAGSGAGGSGLASNRFADDCGGVHAGFEQMLGSSEGCVAGAAGLQPRY